MVLEKSFATLPPALMIVGTAFGSILASFIMSVVGRKYGFMLGSVVTSLSALLASYSITENTFIVFCFANFFIGVGHAFTAQYRFAAAESVSKELMPTAISIILFASIIGAFIGPNIASLTKNLINDSVYTGSYIFLSMLTIIPFFLFIFYNNDKSIKFSTKLVLRRRPYFYLLSEPKFIQAIVASGLAYCTMSFLMTATPISMHIHNNISVGNTGIVIMFHILAMFLPSLVTGNLIKKYGNNRIMYFGVISMLTSIFLNFIDQSFLNYLMGLIFLGLGWNFLFISGTSLLMTSYRPEEKFHAQGLNDFIIFSTQALGALSAGFLLSVFGWKLINLFCVPLLIIIVLTVLISEYQQKIIIKKQ